MFLGKKQLVKMTGYKSFAGQARWLIRNGYRFDVRSDGKPNVLIDQVRERQCKNLNSTPGPDLSWMD